MSTWPPNEPYCPHCGHLAKKMPPLMPGVHLTLAQRLIWMELAKVPGYAVPMARLKQYVAPGATTIHCHIVHLRKKTGRTIRNIHGEGYLLEPSAADRLVATGFPREDGPNTWRRSPRPSRRPIPACSAMP